MLCSFIIIIIIIIFYIIAFMRRIDNSIPVTYHVSRVYSAAAVFYLQFVLHVKFLRAWNMFDTYK